MLIMSYLAVGTWMFFTFISLMLFFSALGSSVASGSGGGAIYAVFGLMICGFILYAGYNNMNDLGECQKKLAV